MAISDNLQAFWEFEEVGTNVSDRQDATANNRDLSVFLSSVTDTTGVVSGTKGVNVGTAAFARSDETWMDFTGDYSIVDWIKFTSAIPDSSNIGLISKLFPREIEYKASHFGSAQNLSLEGLSSAVPFIPTVGTWQMHVIGVRSGNIFLSIDGSTLASNTAPSITHGSAGLAFFGDGGGSIVNQDQTGVWIGRGLSDAEITWLYNSGGGRTYADILAGMGGGTTPKVHLERSISGPPNSFTPP